MTRYKLENDLPEAVSAVYLSLRWDNQQLHGSQWPTLDVPFAELQWLLDCCFWASNPPEQIFDLRPADVMAAPERFPERWAKVQNADTTFPLHTVVIAERRIVLDGLHRLAKLSLMKAGTIRVWDVPLGSLKRVGSDPTTAPARAGHGPVAAPPQNSSV